MKIRIAAVLAGTLAALASSALVAQQPFRATTVVVEVDTIVTDSKGQFVADLTVDDFDVRQDGTPQKIARVYLVDGATARDVTTPGLGGEPDAPGANPPSTPTRVFVLLFDQEHLQESSFKRVRDAAVTFLNTEFKTGDVGGVVLGGVMASNQLTSDREALVAAVRAAKPNFAKTSRRLAMLEWPRLSSEAEAIRIALINDREVLAQAVRRACQDDPSLCKNIDPEAEVMEKARTIVGDLRPAARRTVMALQALASGLARVPGRKTIVLITEGFFVEESWADLRQIVGAAARSNVRVYSLDARGLDTRQSNDLRQQTPMDSGGGMPLDAYNSSEDGPNMLAVDTGGRAIRHTNQFADALKEIARDTSRYYVLGYTPATPAAEGSFHSISVSVKRPGVSVRSRRGYVAAKAAPPPATTSTSTGPPASAPARESPAPESAAAAPRTPSPEAGGIPAPAAPSAGAAASESAANAFRLRPDSNALVRDLALREGGASSNDLAAQGWDRYQKGDVESAADLLGRAAIDPNARPWVNYALGFSELALRHLDKASQAWEKVRAAVPEFRTVYLDLADAYAQSENYGRAIDVLRIADGRWRDDVDILNAIGTIQVRRGVLDDAIGTFTKATEAHADDALAYFNLGRTYELRYFKMRRYLQQERRWVANGADLRNAIASYEHYVAIGGPFEPQARQAIQNLQWMK